MKCRSGEAASVRAMCGIMAPDVTFIRFDFQGEPIASWRVQMWRLQKDSISSETIVLNIIYSQTMTMMSKFLKDQTFQQQSVFVSDDTKLN